MKALVALTGAAIAIGFGAAEAQQPPPQFPEMTFFITGQPGPDGANFGGIEGADKHCQELAAKTGAGGETWRAYLSQQAMDGKPAINARDRVGKGPWRNALGTRIAASVDDLHDSYNYHDILTGTQADGTAPPPGKDLTCGNWTKGGEEGSAMVGHHDRMGLRDDPPSRSWNAAHPSRGCSNARLRLSGGNGLLYCFAAN